MRQLTDDDFQTEVRENLDPILVIFSGSWCSPCKQMKATMEEVAPQMPDIRFAEMDIEQSEKAAAELGIRTVPSLALFADGMIREVFAGTMQKANLRLWIQENI